MPSAWPAIQSSAVQRASGRGGLKRAGMPVSQGMADARCGPRESSLMLRRVVYGGNRRVGHVATCVIISMTCMSSVLRDIRAPKTAVAGRPAVRLTPVALLAVLRQMQVIGAC